jgi:hypothetical protein
MHSKHPWKLLSDFFLNVSSYFPERIKPRWPFRVLCDLKSSIWQQHRLAWYSAHVWGYVGSWLALQGACQIFNRIYCFFSMRGRSILIHLLASPSRLSFTGLGSVSHPAKRPSKETLGSLSLTDDQCAEAFPGLNREIENAIAQGPFELKRAPDDIIFLAR